METSNQNILYFKADLNGWKFSKSYKLEFDWK